MQNNLEIPKYKKKKNSNTSKSNTKSKHKHQYVEALFIAEKFINNKDDKPCHGSYCSVCGKIHNINFFEAERIDRGYYRTLEDDEILEKYKDLEKIYINDVYQKYICIENLK